MASIPFLSERSRDSIDLDKDEALVGPSKTSWPLSKVAMRGRPSLRAILCGLVVLTVLLLLPAKLLLSSRRPDHGRGGHTSDGKHGAELVAVDGTPLPTNFTVVGLIFYGRPKYVDILDCYLKKNLKVNGGRLDYINFVVNTKKQADVAYLDRLLNTTDLYRKVTIDIVDGFGDNFRTIWATAVEDNTLYMKIDDDIVYIHEDAIGRMIDTKLRHPEAHNVAANIINSPLTNWFHYHTQAVYPYLPEPAPAPATRNASTESWRASELPAYAGAAPAEFDFGVCKDGDKCSVGDVGGPTYDGHRWLPLPDTSANLMRTPMARAEYSAWGMGWTSWAIAAQQHYSFFANLERDSLHKYWFGEETGLWNMQYDRYNLNFLAMWGHDVATRLPVTGDDEQEFTVTIPKALARPLLIDTHAIVSHFSFGTQGMLRHTDILARYRSLANELVCTADNQKKALGAPYE